MNKEENTTCREKDKAGRNAQERPRKERQKDEAEYAWKKMGND